MEKTLEAETIDAQDMALLNEKKQNNVIGQLIAEKSVAESKSLELEYNNAVLQIYLKYGLKQGDKIDPSTGNILRQMEKKDA